MGNALKKFKINHIIIEKDEHVSDHPKAHYISPRTIEIFKNYNLYNKIKDIQTSKNINDWRHYRYCGYLLNSNSYYGEIDHFKPGNILNY
jgi:hypothetical protein